MASSSKRHVKVVEDQEVAILPEKVWHAVEDIVEELLRVGFIVLACFANLAERALFVIPNILIMLIVGYAIIVLRYGVVVAAIILYDFIKAIVAIINGALTVASAVTFHHYHKIKPQTLVGSWIITVKNIPKTCKKFMTWQAELFYFIRLGTHSTLCPVVRYTYPIKWLYSLFMAMFQDIIFDPTPGAADGNCKRPSGGMLCWVLGLGYFIVHFLVGFTIIVQIVLAFLPLLKEIYRVIKELLDAAVEETKKATMKVKIWWNSTGNEKSRPSIMPFSETLDGKQIKEEEAAASKFGSREDNYAHAVRFFF